GLQAVASGGEQAVVTSTIGSYFTRPLILSRPALAQASSSSPPGAPPTPIAPIGSAPILILIAPCAKSICGSLAKPPADGVGPMRCAIAPLVSSLRAAPSVSTV